MTSDREHGYARYKLDGCRCYPCAAAASAYGINRERAIAYGTWHPWVPAEPVRQHIRFLQSCDLGLRRIASAAGVDRQRLQAVLSGRPERGTPPQEKIRPAFAAAILAVEPSFDLLADKTIIDGAGTRRRLQALVAIGWSQAKLAERIAWTPANINTLIRRDRVTVATARLVRGLYKDLWNQAPPEDGHRDKIAASRARTYAAKEGWPWPVDWDDDLIDLPDDALKAELGRLVALMDDAEVSRCAVARYRHGGKSVLIAAGAREYARRQKAAARAEVA